MASLDKTITLCSDTIAQQTGNTSSVVELLKQLRAIKTNCSLVTVQAAKAYATEQLQLLGPANFSNEKVVNLYTECKENLQRFEGYLSGETKGLESVAVDQLRAIGVVANDKCCVM
ncbi:MAG TPA: hypothetical protein VI522_03805 [Gammaproteobacteria bacterium]|nr:hypothetical protein [Gammaproteobacteria bacterium]